MTETKRVPMSLDDNDDVKRSIVPMSLEDDNNRQPIQADPGLSRDLQSALVDSYVDCHTVARTHIESMDFWTDKMMHGSAKLFDEIVPSRSDREAGLDFKIKFLHLKMEAPTFVKQTSTSCTDVPFVPNMARQGNSDYSQRQHIRVSIKPCGADAKAFETDIYAGRLLTMVHSRMCALSADGRAKSLELHRERRETKIGCQIGNGLAPVDLKDAADMDLDTFAYHMGECPWDKGGYFIVHGTDKVVVHQEYRRVNVVSVTDNSAAGGLLVKLAAFADDVVDETKADDNFEAAASEARAEEETVAKKKAAASKKSKAPRTTKSAKKNERKRNLHASFMSQCGEEVRTIVNVLVHNQTGIFSISIDHLTKTMPLFLMMHSLGVDTRKGIMELLCRHLSPELAERMKTEMEPSVLGMKKETMSRDAADKLIDEEYRGGDAPYDENNDEQLRIQRYRGSVRKSFLQHLGKADDSATRLKKAEFVAHITRTLCLVRWGIRKPDSPDHLHHKSVAASGRLMYVLWLDAMTRAWTEMGEKVRSHARDNPSVVTNLHDKFNPELVTSAIRQAVATGNWPAFDYSRSGQTGISQTLERHNHEDYAATMARVVNNLKNTHHAFGPMELHNSANGMYDPSATSDTVPGLVKQLCTFTHLTCGMSELDSKRLGEVVRSFLDDAPDGHLVIVDGDIAGRTKRAPLLMHKIRELRAMGCLYRSTSVVTDEDLQTCTIATDHGRHVRVLARLHESKILMCGDSCDASHQKRYTEIAKNLGKRKKNGECRDDLATLLEGVRLRRTLGATKLCTAASGPCILHKLTCMKHSVVKQSAARWRYLEAQGYVDHLDVAELWSATVVARPFADSKQHPEATHGELGPSYLLGPASAVVHMAGFMQTARMLNVNHLARSAIGVRFSNALTRFARGEQHILRYPQQIQGTAYARASGQLDLPNKQLPIVAVCETNGFGQEDAVVTNRSSQERGYSVSDRIQNFSVVVQLRHRKAYIAEKQLEWSTIVHPLGFRDGTVENAKFKDYDLLPKVPLKCLNMRYAGESKTSHVCSKHCSVSPFATSGIATLHQNVKHDQVLVGIVRSWVDPSTKKVHHTDASFRLPVKNQTGIITKIQVVEHDETQVTVTVTVVFELDPYDGQKSAFSYGQKGVQDVALRQEEMPWTVEGNVPDVIINENGFPTRMTVNMLLAMFAGKAGLVVRKILAAELDHLQHLDNFEFVDVALVRKALVSAGYVSDGSEVMYCPRTGERLKGKIFIGPAGVHKPPHMPEEKAHARSLGAKTIGTGQPVKGRSANGGFKFGEMDGKILMIAGASENLLQWLMENSDATTMPFCDDCGMPAVAGPESSGRAWMCRACGFDSEVTPVRLPGSAKHLLHILSFANINMRVFADKQPGFGQGALEDPGSYLDMLNSKIAKRA